MAPSDHHPDHLVRQLGGICGAGHVSVPGPDADAACFAAAVPDVLVHPGTPEEIAAIVELAVRCGQSVIAVGSGSQLRQVLPQTAGGIGLVLSRLDRIIELEPGNLSVTAEAGATNASLQALAASHNLKLPIGADFPDSTIGGQIAADFSSFKRHRFGSLADYVLGLNFVSPAGKLVATGGKTVKNVSGYDFSRLLCGSWGMLGIIYRATLRLTPLPECELLLRRSFASLHEAMQEATRLTSSRAQLDSCNLCCRPGANGRPEIALLLAIEGSREFVDLQRRLLELSANWLPASDGAAAEEIKAARLAQRRELKMTRFHTLTIDKRALPRAFLITEFISRHGGVFDFDLAAGILEFSIPGCETGLSREFTDGWQELSLTLTDCIISSSLMHQPPPLLTRLRDRLDPQRCMFKGNIISGETGP